MIYLDHNATTPVHPEVLEAMLPYFGPAFGNPSSVRYRLGRDAHLAVEEARESVANLLGCTPEEILFTSCGSEANTHAILGSGPQGRPHPRIVTSGIEHHCVLHACRWSRREGSSLVELPAGRDGVVSPAALEEALAAEPASLVSVMWANNETGVVQPVAELAAVAKAHGALFHSDAVQAAGKVPIDLAPVPVDLLAISGHKLHAPKGVGALFVRSGVRLWPRIFGGEQERGLRAGTENVALIVGLGVACGLLLRERVEREGTLRRLRDRLEEGLLARCPGAVVHGRQAERLDNTLALGWEELHSDDLLKALDHQGICASSGSACASVQPEPSHVLIGMGVSPDLARGTLRFSLGPETTEAEIDRVIRVMESVVRDLA